MAQTTESKFEAWCIVELFGHAKIAGLCTEAPLAGGSFLRVDVPETTNAPSFTRMLGSAAIYAINPVDEKTARYMAERIQAKPIDAWDIIAVMKKYSENLLIGQSGAGVHVQESDPEDDL